MVVDLLNFLVVLKVEGGGFINLQVKTSNIV